MSRGQAFSASGRSWLFATLAAVLALLACGGPTFVISQYPGPPRPRETIAILRIDGASPVQLLSVDGDPLAPLDDDVRLHIEVLPGEHSVAVANQALPDQPAQRVRFLAEAGKLYAAAWTAGSPRIFELDDSSGAVLRDVSIISPEEPPAEAPRPVAPPPAHQPAPPPAPPVDAGPPSAPQPPPAQPPPPEAPLPAPPM